MAHDPTLDASTYVPLSGRTLPDKCPPHVGGLVVSPTVLYFHFIPLAAVSEYQSFTLTNTSAANIGVANFAVNNPEFETLGAMPAVLEPGTSVTIQVRFRPTLVGTRLGKVSFAAGTDATKSWVELIGIGGTLTATVIGDATQITNIVNDYLTNLWAYRYGTFAPEDIQADELLLDYHVTQHHTLQPNLIDVAVSIATPPTLEFVAAVLKDNVQVGTISISPTGVITKTTLNGLAVDVPVNSIITVRAPAVAVAAMTRLRMTFVGVMT